MALVHALQVNIVSNFYIKKKMKKKKKIIQKEKLQVVIYAASYAYNVA